MNQVYFPNPLFLSFFLSFFLSLFLYVGWWLSYSSFIIVTLNQIRHCLLVSCNFPLHKTENFKVTACLDWREDWKQFCPWLNILLCKIIQMRLFFICIQPSQNVFLYFSLTLSVCLSLGDDDGHFYTHLGAGATPEDLRRQLELRYHHNSIDCFLFC